MARKKEPSPDPNEEFEVEEIVGHKIDEEEPDRVKYLYRVRWLGYTARDDTWEPKESLEGGAEGILEEYINDRKNNGYVFFRDGSKKSKVTKYLNDNNVDEEVLGYDAGGGTDDELEEEEIEPEQEGGKKKSSSSSKTKKTDKAAAEKEKAEKEKEKERKRKKRESEAAAARNGDDDAVDEDEDERRASSSHNKKHKRNSGSPVPIPPSVLRGRDERDNPKKEKADKEKENAAASASAAESSSKKPSSKRSNGDDDAALTKKKEKRPSQTATNATVTNDSEDDNEAVETSLKRSPLKEKKADQRKSEEPPRSSNNNNTVNKNIDEPVKAPHVATIPISRTTEEEEGADEDLLPLGSEVNSKIASWEDLVTVESLEQQNGPDDKEYKWLIRWNDEIQANGKKINLEEWIGNKLARRKFPQGLLSFYEDHLKFKSTPEDDEDQIEGSQGVNGDAVGGGTAMQQD